MSFTSMYEETIVSTRTDRELRKRIIQPGDYTIVPYEDSRCKIKLSEVKCTNKAGEVCEIEPESLLFSDDFAGILLIGDSDNFIDKDIELILQQMCCGEKSAVSLTYRDNDENLVKQISCNIELLEVTEEQVISDWSWQRLHEAAMHHKEQGVLLVKQKRLPDAFRRFSKALKLVVAIEPAIENKEITDLRVKLYNNLAHIQLEYNEYSAAYDLCDRALKYDPDNLKALYRRSQARAGLHEYEEAWKDINTVLRIDPNNKAAQQKIKELKPILENMNQNYNSVIKKMFR